MIHEKECSAFRFGDSFVGQTSSIATPARSSNETILEELIRARIDCPILPSRCTNELPQRSSPLMSLGLSSPFRIERETEWNPRSLIHQLSFASASSFGQRKTLMKPEIFANANGMDPFPLNSALFSAGSSSNIHPITGDTEFDQRIRSLSAVLMVNQPRIPTRRRPRNQATRYRLVGQALGQKGVQRVVAALKEIKKVQASADPTCEAAAVQNLLKDVLVDAWDEAPIEDLKSLPWEEMLRTSLKHLEAYHAWNASSRM